MEKSYVLRAKDEKKRVYRLLINWFSQKRKKEGDKDEEN
jgi:hypothetical protein